MKHLCLMATLALWITACAQPTPQPTIIVAATATASLPLPTPAPVGEVAINGSQDPAQLKTLLGRMLDWRVLQQTAWVGPSELKAPRLWVAALPDDMPFQLMLPIEAKLIGTNQTSAFTPYEAMIYWETPQTPETALAEVLAQLEAQDIKRWERSGPQPVFTVATAQADFCRTTALLQGSVRAFPNQAGQTEVQLNYTTEPVLVNCDDPVPSMTEYNYKVLPSLKLPEGITIKGEGNASNIQGFAYNSFEFYSSSSLAELQQHFIVQLAEQGWQKLEIAPTGPMAWSRWEKTDEFNQRWMGALVVVGGPAGGDGRMVSFQIELVR